MQLKILVSSKYSASGLMRSSISSDISMNVGLSFGSFIQQEFIIK